MVIPVCLWLYSLLETLIHTKKRKSAKAAGNISINNETKAEYGQKKTPKNSLNKQKRKQEAKGKKHKESALQAFLYEQDTASILLPVQRKHEQNN